MIAQLAGALAQKSPEHIIVDVQGVGYQVFVSLNSFYRLPEPGDRVDLLIHTHVREDALQLYGFIDRQEKDLFLLMIGISGIGPRLGLNILSGMRADELQQAVQRQARQRRHDQPPVRPHVHRQTPHQARVVRLA